MCVFGCVSLAFLRGRKTKDDDDDDDDDDGDDGDDDDDDACVAACSHTPGGRRATHIPLRELAPRLIRLGKNSF